MDNNTGLTVRAEWQVRARKVTDDRVVIEYRQLPDRTWKEAGSLTLSRRWWHRGPFKGTKDVTVICPAEVEFNGVWEVR